MAEIQQLTLTGEPTDEPRVRPDTFRWCQHCGDHVLRSRWGDHEEHHREAAERFAEEELQDDTDEEGDGPVEKVGEVYDVTLSYTVDYRFRIPAWDEHRAKDIAKERVWDAKPVTHDHVHTRIDTVREVYEDDDKLPDDFDPFAGEDLWEAFNRAEEDSDA